MDRMGPQPEWMDDGREQTHAMFRAIVFERSGDQPWSPYEPAFSKIASDVLAVGDPDAAAAYLNTLERTDAGMA